MDDKITLHLDQQSAQILRIALRNLLSQFGEDARGDHNIGYRTLSSILSILQEGKRDSLSMT